MTVRIVTDSASDMPKALTSELDIAVVPLTVRFGDEPEIVDGTITPPEFWRRCQSAPVLPQTSAPSAGDFEEAFRKAGAGGDGVVCVTLSSDLSATFSSATAAAQALEGEVQVKVVDTRSCSMGEGLIALAAHEAAQNGASLDEVAEVARSAAERTRVFAALDTLEYLRKGGRIGGAQAMIGSLLSIKPIIEIHGTVDSESKQRTRTRAMQYLVDKVKAVGPIDRLGIVHAEAPDVEEFTEMLEPLAPASGIIVGDVGAVIGAHSGPRLLGVTYQTPS